MTLICLWLCMFSDVPILMFMLAMACDTVLLTVAMLLGVIHR